MRCHPAAMERRMPRFHPATRHAIGVAIEFIDDTLRRAITRRERMPLVEALSFLEFADQVSLADTSELQAVDYVRTGLSFAADAVRTYVDVVDGEEGQEPNRAMEVMTAIQEGRDCLPRLVLRVAGEAA